MNTIDVGSGGLAAVSLWVVAAILLVAVVGTWKIVKILWAMFG